MVSYYQYSLSLSLSLSLFLELWSIGVGYQTLDSGRKMTPLVDRRLLASSWVTSSSGVWVRMDRQPSSAQSAQLTRTYVRGKIMV